MESLNFMFGVDSTVGLAIEPNRIHLKGSFYESIVAEIKLFNQSSKSIAFDIECPDERLLIRPSRDIIKERCLTCITVVLKAQPGGSKGNAMPVKECFTVNWLQLGLPEKYDVDAVFSQQNGESINRIPLYYTIENARGVVKKDAILVHNQLLAAPKVFSFPGPYEGNSTLFFTLTNPTKQSIAWKLTPSQPFWYSLGEDDGLSAGGVLLPGVSITTYVDCKVLEGHFKKLKGPFDESKQTFSLATAVNTQYSIAMFEDQIVGKKEACTEIKCQFDSKFINDPCLINLFSANFKGPYNRTSTSDVVVLNSNPRRVRGFRLLAMEPLWYDLDSTIQTMPLLTDGFLYPLKMKNLYEYYKENGGKAFNRKQFFRLESYFIDNPDEDHAKQMRKANWRRQITTIYVPCYFDEVALESVDVFCDPASRPPKALTFDERFEQEQKMAAQFFLNEKTRKFGNPQKGPPYGSELLKAINAIASHTSAPMMANPQADIHPKKNQSQFESHGQTSTSSALNSTKGNTPQNGSSPQYCRLPKDRPSVPSNEMELSFAPLLVVAFLIFLLSWLINSLF